MLLNFLFLLILADVLSEDVILKWYTSAHSSKGKGHFLEQMKKFVEWLQNAEEGKRIYYTFLKIRPDVIFANYYNPELKNRRVKSFSFIQ